MELIDAVETVFAVVTVTVALGLVWLNRTLPSVLLATFMLSWGVAGLTNLAEEVGMLTPDGATVVVILAAVWLFAAILAFSIVFPNVTLTRGRRVTLAAIAVFAVLASVALAATADRWAGDRIALANIMGTLSAVGYPAATALLGRRWLASGPGDYRTQVAWGLIPITFWNLHDSLGFVVFPLMFGRLSPSVYFGHPVGLVVNGAILASVAFTLVLAAVAFLRLARGRGARDDRALAFVVLYALPVTLVQIVAPRMHFLLDYLIVPLIVYGVLRFRVVDIDLKLRWGLKHSTVAAAFLAAFFVVGTVAQELLADTLGWLAGGVAAGALLFAIAPLQRAAERVSTIALPHARDAEGYLNYRRYQIYKVALEGTLRDGVVEPAETSALRSLREELGLTPEDHAMLEREVRTRLAPVAVTPGA